MQLFRTEMLFLHPPQPVAPHSHYGRRRGLATGYGHARVRLPEPPSVPAQPATTRDLERAA